MRASLWLAVVASGLYHGVNPAMGWPLAVSAGLMEKSSNAVVAALWLVTVGHLLAMLVVILPFSLLLAVAEWEAEIQIGASLLMTWSFAVAIAHGAGPDAPTDLSRTLPGQQFG
jgi:hypothetical protein